MTPSTPIQKTFPGLKDPTAAKIYMSLAFADLQDPTVGSWLAANGYTGITACQLCGESNFEHIVDCSLGKAISAMSVSLNQNPATSRVIKQSVSEMKDSLKL